MSDRTKGFIQLFEERFIIPQYQRGYRWEPQEVTELLNDLWSFEKTSNKGEFYCLQPIVVQKKEDDACVVLDGQQRLTTLYLIVSFLEDIRQQLGYTKALFPLSYETRPGSEEFLEERKFKLGINTDNVDYFYMTQAYQCIKNWFADPKHTGAIMKLVPILLDKNDKGNRNIRFIWYEAEKHINPIDIFVRLNVGKIPLTDAELIKALLLQTDKYTFEELVFIEHKLLEIANEWDNIEYTLQNDEFWYFLNKHENEKPTHIEFIFDLIANRINKEQQYSFAIHQKHGTFLLFDKYLQDLLDSGNYNRIQAVEEIWKQVINHFEYFKNWFANRTFYHYIGFLVAVSNYQNIETLIDKSKVLSKSWFEKYLESEIGKTIKINRARKDSQGNDFLVGLADFQYELEDGKKDDQPDIHRILLLHNVYAALKSDKEKARFPFNLFKQTKKKEKWSLEHIHARNTDTITNRPNQNTWLDDHIKSVSGLGVTNNKTLIALIDEMRLMRNAEKIDKEEFEDIVERVYRIIEEVGAIHTLDPHSIDNLCLVDANTNSQLNSSVFDVKRELIKKRELAGHYIPECTRNVFLKAYTEYPVSNAYWTAEDRKCYFIRIEEVYNRFVNAII